jgi:hypothetical protein
MKCVDGALTDTVGRSERRCDRGEGLELGREERRNHNGTKNDCRGSGKGPGPGLLCMLRGSDPHPSDRSGGEPPNPLGAGLYPRSGWPFCGGPCVLVALLGMAAGQSIISLPFCSPDPPTPPLFTEQPCWQEPLIVIRFELVLIMVRAARVPHRVQPSDLRNRSLFLAAFSHHNSKSFHHTLLMSPNREYGKIKQNNK